MSGIWSQSYGVKTHDILYNVDTNNVLYCMLNPHPRRRSQYIAWKPFHISCFWHHRLSIHVRCRSVYNLMLITTALNMYIQPNCIQCYLNELLDAMFAV